MYAVHSLVDFTWFVPGVTVLAVLCAGWLAGRGPWRAAAATSSEADPAPSATPTAPAGPTLRARMRDGAQDRTRLAGAIAVAVIALAAAWATWQPERSFHAGNEALALLDAGKTDQARQKAIRARELNPLSIEPLFDRSAVELRANRKVQARTALEQAVRLQPSNPTPWIRLAEFELLVAGNPRVALDILGPALYLDPRSTSGVSLFLDAKRRVAADPTRPRSTDSTIAPPGPTATPVAPVAPTP